MSTVSLLIITLKKQFQHFLCHLQNTEKKAQSEMTAAK